jgi:hypothetical protein
MAAGDDDLRVQPGRISQSNNKGGRKPESFVGQVMRAVKKAGHTTPARTLVAVDASWPLPF